MNNFLKTYIVLFIIMLNGSIAQNIEPIYKVKNIENKTVSLFVEAFDYLHSINSFEIRCLRETIVDEPGNNTRSESKSTLRYFKNLKDTIYGASFSIKNEYMYYFYHNYQYFEVNNKTKKIVIYKIQNSKDILPIVNNEYDYFIINNIVLLRNNLLKDLKHSNLSYIENEDGEKIVNYSYSLPDFHYSDSIDLVFYSDIPLINQITINNKQFNTKVVKRFKFLGLEKNILLNENEFQINDYNYNITYNNLTDNNNAKDKNDTLNGQNKVIFKNNDSKFENQLISENSFKLIFFWVRGAQVVN